MVIEFQKPGRTLVADWSTAITSYSVTLNSHNGYASLSQASVPAGSSASFPGVGVGTWDVVVVAHNGAAVVGGGSLLNQTVTSAGSPVWTVPISSTQTGTGGFSLTFSFPGTATGIDTVTWQMPNPPANSTGFATPQIVTLSGGPTTWTGTVAQGGVTSGAYRLVLTFYRGGVGGAVAGSYSEAVNIWDNVTSSSWLDSTGTLQPSRTFAATEFNSTDTSLVNLTSSAGTWGTLVAGVWNATSFSSSTANYTLTTNSSVTFVPSESLVGQKIRYQSTGTTTVPTWTSLASGNVSMSVSPGSVVTFQVTANDGATTGLYSVAVGTQANSDWSVVSPPVNTVSVSGPSTVYYGNPTLFTGSYSATASTYAWYLDGSVTPITGATTATLGVFPKMATMPFGAHTLMLEVKDASSGISYSNTAAFTVTNNNTGVTGLSGEWLMAGNPIDSSGNGNDLMPSTATGTLTPTTDRFGGAGKAYAFGGGYLFEPAEITPAAGLFTWAVWFNYTSDGAMLISQAGIVGAGGVTRSLSVTPSTHYLNFNLVNGGSSVSVDSSSTVTSGAWHLAVGVYDGVNATLYLDGVATGSQPYTQGTSSTSDFYVGESPEFTDYSSVQSLDDIRVYGRALSAAEVNTLYHEGGY